MCYTTETTTGDMPNLHLICCFQPPLIQAIFKGDYIKAQQLIEANADVDYQDEEKCGPLHAVAFTGDHNLAQLLLEYGARVNSKDCKWLTPLHRACRSGKQVICLEDNSFELDSYKCFDSFWQILVFGFLFLSIHPLQHVVEVLLSNKADTNARDKTWQTPLHIAAAFNSYECVELLLQVSTNVNVSDRTGQTPLHLACFYGHDQVAQLLIKNGASVNAFDKKDRRGLHLAAFMGHKTVVQVLLQSGAEVNIRDKAMSTPLHAVTTLLTTLHSRLSL